MSETRVTTIWFALMLTLLTSSTLGQVTECTSSPKLRFVAQLNINGCPIFVHDTGAKDGPHLAVEPLMCVTQSFHKTLLQYDHVIQQTYASVPVMLRDDAMLTEVEHQLRHLSPKSVKFATVSDVNVSADSSSKLQALGFDWKPNESTGIMRLACGTEFGGWCVIRYGNQVFKHFLMLEAMINQIRTRAVINSNGTRQCQNYHMVMQNRSLIDSNIRFGRYSDFSNCNQLRFIRSISINNYIAQVHERQDMKGHFLIEPLLCHNITSITNDSVMYDYSRDMYYLKLDVVLQDDITLDAVRSKLADLSPLSLTFMRLWRAESVVASALSRRFEIGGLMVSGDWRSGQIRVYCRTEDECENLMSWVPRHPSDLWRHISWTLTSVLFESALCQFVTTRHHNQIQVSEYQPGSLTLSQVWNTFAVNCPNKHSKPCKFLAIRDGRQFEMIQQRLTGGVSFRRGWSEYESGFGDGIDFWIGLSRIHSLSINGATLRVEMKLWNGTELHMEFVGFNVEDASTNYTIMIGDMMRNRSSPSLTVYGIFYHRGMQFSTLDRQSSSAKSDCFTRHLIKKWLVDSWLRGIQFQWQLWRRHCSG